MRFAMTHTTGPQPEVFESLGGALVGAMAARAMAQMAGEAA